MLPNFRIMQKKDCSFRIYQNLKITHAARSPIFSHNTKLGYATFCWFCDAARNLGVHMDQIREHVKKICRSSMSALKSISQIRNFLSKESTEKLIHAFVSSRIDSCNALLFGITEKDIFKLQIVQNSAARIVERARRRDPITPMLTRLHWLPVDKRIVYKMVLLCHKVIIHQSPTYLTNIITP